MSSWSRYTDQYHTLPELVSQHLERYVGLSRAGKFNEAERLFSQTLSRHVEHPPVFFERADALLNQGRFGMLSDLLAVSARRFEHGSDQLRLLVLMQHLANIYVSGGLLSALLAAREFKTSMRAQTEWGQSSAYQVYLLTSYGQEVLLTSLQASWRGVVHPHSEIFLSP